jgi:hypothetical protein
MKASVPLPQHLSPELPPRRSAALLAVTNGSIVGVREGRSAPLAFRLFDLPEGGGEGAPMRLVIAAIALFVACLPAPARAAPCPDGYFQAEASNTIAGTGATLNPTVCVLITTARTHIDMKLIVLANVTNVQALEEKVLRGLGASSDCGGLFSLGSLTSVGGWDVSEMKLSFVRTPASAVIHGSAKVKVCNFATGIANALGGTFQLDAVLNYKLEGEVLSFQIDPNRLRLRPAFANQYRDKIYSVFNTALSQYSFTPYAYLPPKLRPYMQDLSPRIDNAGFQVNQNQLMLRVAMSASLTKATADEALRNATSGWTVEDIINFLRSHIGGGRTS